MKFTALTAIAALLAAPVFAGGADDDTLILNDEITMVTKATAPAHMAETGIDEVISGWHFRKDETQQQQTDDFENQGMIFVDQALEQWEVAEGSEGKSCADCHNDPESLAGVSATYPKWNEEAGELRTVQMQMNDCRVNRMGADAWKYDAGAAINMEALIASQSRGMPVNVQIDGPVADAWQAGKDLYYTRTGILELSCASCHEQNYGNFIRADHLSQGQINGFPTYRLKNAKLNGVHSRFRGCIRDTRAETYATGSPEFVALELYVKSRSMGLSVEGPSVRN